VLNVVGVVDLDQLPPFTTWMTTRMTPYTYMCPVDGEGDSTSTSDVFNLHPGDPCFDTTPVEMHVPSIIPKLFDILAPVDALLTIVSHFEDYDGVYWMRAHKGLNPDMGRVSRSEVHAQDSENNDYSSL
jgi:hypothetical protein